MASLRVAIQTIIPTTIGAIIRAMGHSGRLRSCSMVNKTAMAKGKIVRKSSNVPTK